MTLTATAPGKLFLTGEYAVLDGAPALLTAVAARARVTLVPGSGRVTSTTTSRSGASVADVPVVSAVAGTLGVDPPVDLDLALDTAPFFRAGAKLGYGSSAALTAALTAALAYRLGRDTDPESLLPLAVQAHRQFQGGIGSGGDVASAVHGGTIRFSNAGGVSARPVDPDPELLVRPVWTAVAASTVDYVGAVLAWRESDAAAAKPVFDQLDTLAAACADKIGDAASFCAAVADYNRALQLLSERSGAHFYTPLHQQIDRLAQENGLTYKPSGAGGGDFGLCFGRRGEEDHFDALGRALDPTSDINRELAWKHQPQCIRAYV